MVGHGPVRFGYISLSRLAGLGLEAADEGEPWLDFRNEGDKRL
jgi:hypothetical protein